MTEAPSRLPLESEFSTLDQESATPSMPLLQIEYGASCSVRVLQNRLFILTSIFLFIFTVSN